MQVRILFKNKTIEKIYEEVRIINYNYNGVGDIQIEHGKYQVDYSYIDIKTIERMSVI